MQFNSTNNLKFVEGKYQSIQLLRAIAALMVVVLHSKIGMTPEARAQLLWWPGFSDFGWQGVPLFFTISGFIIASVLSRPNFSRREYFLRRFIRIYPLYWVVMGTGIYFYFTRNWFKGEIDLLGSEGLIKSFLIFPMKDHPFWEPGWSLEHEIIFYIIAAIVAPLLGLRWLAAIMISLGLFGMFFQVGWDFHLFHESQLYFGAGVAAYLLKNRTWREAIPVAVSSFVLAYGQFYKTLALGDNLANIAFAIGAASLIIGLIDFERRGWQVPKFLVLIGNASFSLYLWHWLVIPLSSRWDDQGGAPELWRWIIVVVSISAAIASYYLIERPLISFSHRK